ncbi:MAG: selenocysteine-specific translation elongation factor [Acidobacteriia bacterium]|nr:selenocysteine-specific translation elongation factor [Terriglobia bacterium]
MAEPQHFIVATAGHVDHGKSALVKALTGTDPDRLPEEKARGITIDLGFAHLELPASVPGPSSFLLGIVDVPGHEDFVKNMVAGVGSIDLALFVVAADDGWMPQTEEHLQILTYLGVNRAVVALTKIDLIQDERRAAAAIHNKLRDSPFADAPIVPTSVVTGRGLDHLKAALARVLANTPASRDIGKPRLPVDRVFTLRGIGTVVTGTLTGGTLRRGQSVVIQPSGKVARIRNIQSHNHNVELGVPGTRTALNLPDIAASDDVRRGDVVTLAEFGGPSEILDVALEVSPRANRPLRDGAQVRFHHGSANVRAKVVFFSHKELAPGEQALGQLRLEGSVFVFAGDRFVLRDSAGQNTLAGGVVLDPDPSRKLFRSEARLSFLRQRAESPCEALPFVASQIARDRAVRRSQLLLKSKFSAADISNAVSRLAAEGNLVLAGGFAVDAARWQLLRRRAADAIEARHRTHPEQTGLSLSDLRTILEADLPFADLFEPLVGDLCRSEFVQVGNTIRRVTHRRALPPPLQAAAAKLRATLAAKPFDPPSRKQLAPDSVSQQALRFLIETGEAVEISAEVVLTAESLKRMAELIRQYIRDNGPATVSDLRQELICSRRVIVPLLERLDRDGITLRNGDARTLCAK